MVAGFRRRPPVVIAAAGLLGAAGALFAGEVLLSGDKYFTEMRTFEQAAADRIVPNDTAFAAFGVLIHWIMTVVGVFTGAVLVVLAVFIFFGRSWARVVTWLFGRPILLWYGVLAALTFLAGAVAGDTPNPDPAELIRRYTEAWPPWLDTLDTTLMAAVTVLLIGALVSQTVPAADAYFRTD
jgi:predicted DNA repair protein MutK